MLPGNQSGQIAKGRSQKYSGKEIGNSDSLYFQKAKAYCKQQQAACTSHLRYHRRAQNPVEESCSQGDGPLVNEYRHS